VPFNLPRAQLPHLPGAPLKIALVQVRYRTVLAIERPEDVATFQERLGGSYELIDRQLTPSVRVFVGDQILEPSPPPLAESLFRFQDRDNGWWVALSSSSLGFEASRYRRFPDFAAEFRRVVRHLLEVFAPKTQTRLGMRYINEIADPRLEGSMTAILVPSLVAPLGTELGTDLVSSLSELRFQQPDGLFVLRHGLVGPATYVLDFDYFDEEERPFDVDGILARTDAYHSVIESLFAWCLTPEYLNELASTREDEDGKGD
jgi:uncharacterized protein (TIGR04255 family)